MLFCIWTFPAIAVNKHWIPPVS